MSKTATQPQRTRTGRKPNPVHLNPDDERLLREVVECPYWAEWQLRRVKVILERAAGASIKELVQKVGFSRASIQRTCLTYAREGIAGLMTRKQITGGPRKYFSSNDPLDLASAHDAPCGRSPDKDLGL